MWKLRLRKKSTEAKVVSITNDLVHQLRESIKGLEAENKTLLYQNEQLHKIGEAQDADFERYELKFAEWQLRVSQANDLCLKYEDNITALKSIVANLRRQKVYAGQKFYNPANHNAPTVYVCARWNEWYIVRQQNEATPRLITADVFKEQYPGYEVLPAMNLNRKNLA